MVRFCGEISLGPVCLHNNVINTEEDNSATSRVVSEQTRAERKRFFGEWARLRELTG